MTQLNSKSGQAVLMLGHIAGMVDMVALPLWVGTLMQNYAYSPQQAGLTVTLFLAAVAITSMVLSPQFNRLPQRWLAAFGFALAAGAFYAVSQQSMNAAGFGPMAALHLAAGVGIGCGLSMTHGALGRTHNPHRMFAWANGLLGAFAVLFMGSVPKLMQSVGGTVVFTAFVAVMSIAAIAVALAFPQVKPETAAMGKAGEMGQSGKVDLATQKTRIPPAAWFAIFAVVCLTMNQAIVFSFLERVGAERGFSAASVGGVLLALGLVNLLPSPLAGFLEKRLPATAVATAAPIVQAALALVIFNATAFMPYAVTAALFVAPVLFGHIFLFGLISRLDPSGRAAASTPAMVMLGSAIGPILGGGIVQQFGYPGVGIASVVIAAVAVVCARQSKRLSSGLETSGIQSGLAATSL
jgi:predicted MFS family arabinose efflux permease